MLGVFPLAVIGGEMFVCILIIDKVYMLYMFM